MVDRRDRRSSRATRRHARAGATARANARRTTKAKGRAKAAQRAKPAARQRVAKPARPRGASGRKRTAQGRPVKRRATTTSATPAPPTPSLPESVVRPPVSSAVASAPPPPSTVAAEPGAVVVRTRRRRAPRVKFTRWLYSEELYRQLGVSPRGQALVCRELRAERDGTWSARVAAVPAGFFEPTWVTVPPEVVVPVPRPKPAEPVR